jgi:hypothetical protein
MDSSNNDLLLTIERLKEQIKAGNYRREGLREEFNRYTDYKAGEWGKPQYGADGLDRLLDGLMRVGERGFARPEVEEIAPYEPAPARVVLELAD